MQQSMTSGSPRSLLSQSKFANYFTRDIALSLVKKVLGKLLFDRPYFKSIAATTLESLT
jgi:hypothetical protein